MVNLQWPPQLLVDSSFERRILAVLALQALVAFYLQSFVHNLRVGLPRFLAALPALALLLAFPVFFSITLEVLPRTSLLFTCSWLGTHKVLAMCLNRGPLARPLSLIQFLTLLYLPVFPQDKASNDQVADTPKGRLHDAAGGPLQLAVQAAIKIAVLGGVVYLISAIQLSGIIKNLLYSLGLVGFLGLIMDGPASLATSVIGLRIIPTFDQPWLSSSLADFWGRRWNITTSSVLRTLYYDPLVEGHLIKLVDEGEAAGLNSPSGSATPTGGGDVSLTSKTLEDLKQADNASDANTAVKPAPRSSKWRRLVGAFCTFAASGLAHEFIINMLLPAKEDGSRPWMWKWTLYFTLQAPMLIAETHLRRLWRKAGLLPPNIWVARAITISFLLIVADPLFFAPCDRDSGLASLVVERVTENFAAVGQLLAVGHGVAAGLTHHRVEATLHAAATSEL